MTSDLNKTFHEEKSLNRELFKAQLASRTEEAEEIIKAYLPDPAVTPGKLAEAMNYSILAGGKRIRPVLLIEAYRLSGGTEEVFRPFAAAIEMIHTSSLIHDDLPAIDNDDLRRGRKTVHAVYGEALGVLAGDALLNYAYETAVRGFQLTKHPDRAAEALRILAGKSGIGGMLGGQGVDVENEKNNVVSLGQDTLDYIYLHKMAALLEAPLMIGAVLAGCDSSFVRKIGEAGTKAGLAFQIRDDVMDVTETAEEMGKPSGSDEKNDKTTYVTLFGVKGAEEIAVRLSREAAAILAELPGDTDFLEDFVLELADRKK